MNVTAGALELHLEKRIQRSWVGLAGVGLVRLAWLAVCVGAIAHIAVYCAVALGRMNYPFPIEWLEDASVQSVARILAGQSLYTEPSFGYVPLIYTPLYFYVSAAVALVVGDGFLPLRIVSFAASLGTIVLVFLIVRRETTNPRAGLVAAGLFSASFPLSGFWFDLARVDSFQIFWLLSGVWLVRFRGDLVGGLLAGVAIALAVLSKQTALVPAAFLLLYAGVTNRHQLLGLLTSATVIGLLAVAVLNATSNGWFAYYLMGLPAQHRFVRDLALQFFTQDLSGPSSIMVLLASFGLLALASFDHGSKRLLFWGAAAGGLVLSALLGRANAGAFVNALIPGYAAVALLAGIGFHEGLQLVKRVPAARQWLLQVWILGLVGVQFLLLSYHADLLVPRQRDSDAGTNLIQTIRSIPGDVFLPDSSYLAERAGKTPYANNVAVEELVGTFGGRPTSDGQRLLQEVVGDLQRHRFSAVILSKSPDNYWFGKFLEQYYQRQPVELIADSDAFRTIVGSHVRPTIVYLPRQSR